MTAGQPVGVLAVGDDLGRVARSRRTALTVTVLAAGLLLTMVIAVGVGSVGIAPGAVARAVWAHLRGVVDPANGATTDDIVWLVRLPRVLLGALVGAALAASGVALQAMVRNILADPYLIGVTSGASTGAAAAILFGLGAALGASAAPVMAFAGAAAAAALVFALARSGGPITPVRLILAGVSVTLLLSAVTSFLIFASDSRDAAAAVLFWLLGSLAQARWSALPATAVAVVLGVAVLMVWGRRFDALAIGDDTAHTLGVPLARVRTQALAVVAVCVGAAVAVSGAVGFVGLIIPHVARRMVGGEHRRSIVIAALLGAIFLLWADIVARVVFAPRELPLGIVTAVVGAPLLMILVRRFHGVS